MIKIAIFGDSISDTGNFARKLRVGGMNLAGKTNDTGRFAESKTWVDLLCMDNGVDVRGNNTEINEKSKKLHCYSESKKLRMGEDGTVVVNYSESGALGLNEGFQSAQAPLYRLCMKTLNDMISTHRTDLTMMNKDEGLTINIVFIGANDVIGMGYDDNQIMRSADAIAEGALELANMSMTGHSLVVGTMPINMAEKWDQNPERKPIILRQLMLLNGLLKAMCALNSGKLTYIDMNYNMQELHRLSPYGKKKSTYKDNLHPNDMEHRRIFSAISGPLKKLKLGWWRDNKKLMIRDYINQQQYPYWNRDRL